MRDLRTIRDALDYGASRVGQREALLLLSHVTDWNHTSLRLKEEYALPDEAAAVYCALLDLRLTKMPLQYIIGCWSFMGLDFWVRPEVLIPRPDTEILVECVLDFIQTSRPLVLDLCTGSGCIGIALAHYSAASVTAIDISPQALALAQKNAVLNGVDNIHFRLSDLFTNLPENQRYDLIVSNPPYIPTAEIAALDEDVRLFEPHTALDGGADGLDLYRRIIQESPSRLRSGGALFLELGDRAGVEALMRQAGFVNITVTRDYAGFERVLSGVFFERN